MTLRHLTAAALVIVAGLTGCGQETPTPGTSVDVTGTVTAGGRPVQDAYVYLHAVGGKAQPIYFKLGTDGSFSGKVIAGEYSWYVTVPDGVKGSDKQKGEAALKSIPEAFRAASLDRKISISDGSKLDLQVK